MRTSGTWWVWILALLAVGCSVMPARVEQEALPEMPFTELIRQAGNYLGRTVIVGGYVVKVQNLKDGTKILAVQAPLGSGREPKAKDLSQGRLILVDNGFLDPEVYTKDRKITVGGKILGSSATDKNPEPYPYLRVAIDEIYLWPVPRHLPVDPYWDPWWYPYPYPWYWRHPYPYYWDR